MQSSAAKPGAYGVFVWYNIGWLASRFNNLGKHETTLSEDLNQAIVDYDPSGIFLSECGEIDKGLPKDLNSSLAHFRR